jgi:hypothetical protein
MHPGIPPVWEPIRKRKGVIATGESGPGLEIDKSIWKLGELYLQYLCNSWLGVSEQYSRIWTEIVFWCGNQLLSFRFVISYNEGQLSCSRMRSGEPVSN